MITYIIGSHSTTNSSKTNSKDSKVCSSKHSTTQSSAKDTENPSFSEEEKQSNLEEKVVKKATPAKERRIKKAMGDALRPMTYSEIDYQNQQNTNSKAKSIPLKELLKKDHVSPITIQQIDQEIEQLKFIKERIIMASKGKKSNASSLKENKENLYENLKKNKPTISDYASVHHNKDKTSSTNSSSGWDSHYNMKNFINNNRLKLKTPMASSQESIVTFINNRKDNFAGNYEKQKNHIFLDNIYTKPYSRRHNVAQYTTVDQGISKSNKTPSDEVFMSSGSISIPVRALIYLSLKFGKKKLTSILTICLLSW